MIWFIGGALVLAAAFSFFFPWDDDVSECDDSGLSE